MCACACLCVSLSIFSDLLTSYESSPITSTTPSLSWVLQRICPGADMVVHFFHLTKSCAGNSSHGNDHPFCRVASFELKHLDGSDPGSFHQKYTRISVKYPEISELNINQTKISKNHSQMGWWWFLPWYLPCFTMFLPCVTHMKSQISHPPTGVVPGKTPPCRPWNRPSLWPHLPPPDTSAAPSERSSWE